jgi:hypothetical protein
MNSSDFSKFPIIALGGKLGWTGHICDETPYQVSSGRYLHQHGICEEVRSCQDPSLSLRSRVALVSNCWRRRHNTFGCRYVLEAVGSLFKLFWDDGFGQNLILVLERIRSFWLGSKQCRGDGRQCF